MKRRRTRLLATIAALLVLQSPLCALACLSLSAAAMSAMPEMAAGEGPCHETASHTPDAPAAPTDADDPAPERGVCGCSVDEIGAVLQTADSIAYEQDVAAPLDRALARALPSDRTRRLLEPRHVDLPPPDILLLKSTLIL